MVRSSILALALAGCTAPTPSMTLAPADSTASGVARGGLTLTIDGGLYWGETATWSVSGAAPDERVYFVYSTAGELDDGFCPGPLGGTCMDLAPPARLFDNRPADAEGVARGSFTFPDLERLGFSMSVQAAIPRGDRGVDSVTTNVLTQPIESLLSPPVARDDGYRTDEDTPLTVDAPGILANDSDADGDALEIFVIERPTAGLLELDPDGGFTYTPGGDLYGVDSFTYQLSDGLFPSEEAVVVITVDSVNDLPFGVADVYEGVEDTTLSVGAPSGVVSNDLDLEGDPLTATLDEPPTNGTLVLRANGSFDYTPRRDFWGEDSFTYMPTDADFGPPVIVSLFITPVNDAPVASPDGYSTDEDVLLEVDGLDGVLANDTDVDLDRLEPVLKVEPANGTLILGRDGGFGYLPDDGWSGLDSFRYAAFDGIAESATVTVTVSVGDVNDPPYGVPEGYPGVEDESLVVSALDGVLANDVDLDGDALTASLVVAPTNGSLILSADGSFAYTPDPNFWGEDTFTYRASDGLDVSDAITVTLGIAPVNDVPIARDDAYATPFGTTLVVGAPGGVSANDSDVEGEFEPRPGDTPPAGGELELNPDGSFTYTPALCFTGVDAFTYVAFDGADESPEATVTIDVGAPSPEEDAFCNAFQPVIPRDAYTDFDFDGFPVRTMIPPGATGLLFAFHGSGGSAQTVTATEYTELYNILYDAGIGVVATDSTTRAPESEWDTRSVDAVRNDDFPRLSALRDHLIDTTDVGADTPILATGFSNGGNFTVTFAEIAGREGWPFTAFSIHNSAPFGAPAAPGWWTTNVNDDRGTPGSVRSAHLSHAATGAPSEYRLADEEVIHPMYFRKIPGTSHQVSQDVFDDMVAYGLLDADGNSIPAVDVMEGALSAWLRDTSIPGPERYSSRVRPAWALHRVTALFADEEAAFLSSFVD
ncbi:MAG: hypothetical protein ACI9K2_000980 [Myxococcota bacterium]|jgi:hypothetical protein